MAFEDLTTEQIQQALYRCKEMEKAKRARDEMLPFMEMMWPDPDNADNPDMSAFEATPLAKMLCQIIEKMDKGEMKRVCVSVGPQLGKSQVLSRGAPAWLSGRNPRRNMILGSYNDGFAAEFGGEVRDIFYTPRFKLIFPKHGLKQGSEAKNLLISEDNGKMAFVGTGGSGTGKPADFFFVDDPYKNDEDAQSETYREKVWKWFNAVAMTRCHGGSSILIVHTRWHEDDLIGRLCDPEHPERDGKYKGIADDWLYFNLPAVIEDPRLAKELGLVLEVPTEERVIKQFGKKPMVSLWANRKPLKFLAEAKMMDHRVFGALYMGKPSPDAGTYFQEADILEYRTEDLPKNLRKYGASDHAVSEKQKADLTALGCVGVDENDDIWILPDIVWERMETDRTVEEILLQMKTHRPECWWMESELISKSFGPFLRRRMYEEKVYTMLDPQVPSKDKRLRARSIQGRMAMKKVHFPKDAPWWPAAKQQLLKFPYGSNDDFVDFISWIGLGLTKEYGATRPLKDRKVAATGTIDWVIASSKARDRREQSQRAVRGW